MTQMPRIPFGTPRGGLITAMIGVAIAALLLLIGFWKTLLIAVLGGVGYFLGASNVLSGDIKSTFAHAISQKNESDEDH